MVEHRPNAPPPRGVLFDYGGTLVEEVEFNYRAGVELLLAHAANPTSDVLRAKVIERADRVSREVTDRRDSFQIETPWTSLTRLIHDFCGTRFTTPLADLELPFWNACVKTRAMPGAREALMEFHDHGIPMGVVSNSSFGQATIRHELTKHGLADLMKVIVVSAEYAVRKPNSMLFETAAALLGVPCADVWFVGDRVDTDIVGARAAGMTPVLFSPTERGAVDGERIALTWLGIATMLRETVA